LENTTRSTAQDIPSLFFSWTPRPRVTLTHLTRASPARSRAMALTGERFELGSRIGRGTSGDVHRAVDRLTGDTVAVKLVDLEDADDEVEDIQREIATLAQIDSPFVTKYLGSWLCEGSTRLAIAMEYMAGGSVADLVRSRPLPEEQCAVVLRDLLMALAYLHGEGKIHRDVKAANVLLSADGSVRLADFGVAGQMTHTVGGHKRKTFTGTPFWMAPEVIQQRPEGYDAKADVWSLGITAIEIATGAPPYADMHPMRVLFFIPKNPPPRLDGDAFSDEFKQFVNLCLQKEPSQRPRARELSNSPFIANAPESDRLGLTQRIHERIADRDGKLTGSRKEKEKQRTAPEAERARFASDVKRTQENADSPARDSPPTREYPHSTDSAPGTSNPHLSAPSWDFGDGTIGRRFGKPPSALAMPSANPKNFNAETSPTGAIGKGSPTGLQTQRYPSHPSRRPSGAVPTSVGSGQKNEKTSPTKSPPAATSAGTPQRAAPALVTLVLSPALVAAAASGGVAADACAQRVAAAFLELELVAPGACAVFLQTSLERVSKIKDDAEIRALAETGARVFAGAVAAPTTQSASETLSLSGTQNSNKSVLGDFLLARWQRDLK